jgi:hypothetical protein
VKGHGTGLEPSVYTCVMEEQQDVNSEHGERVPSRKILSIVRASTVNIHLVECSWDVAEGYGPGRKSREI